MINIIICITIFSFFCYISFKIQNSIVSFLTKKNKILINKSVEDLTIEEIAFYNGKLNELNFAKLILNQKLQPSNIKFKNRKEFEKDIRWRLYGSELPNISKGELYTQKKILLNLPNEKFSLTILNKLKLNFCLISNALFIIALNLYINYLFANVTLKFIGLIFAVHLFLIIFFNNKFIQNIRPKEIIKINEEVENNKAIILAPQKDDVLKITATLGLNATINYLENYAIQESNFIKIELNEEKKGHDSEGNSYYASCGSGGGCGGCSGGCGGGGCG